MTAGAFFIAFQCPGLPGAAAARAAIMRAESMDEMTAILHDIYAS